MTAGSISLVAGVTEDMDGLTNRHALWIARAMARTDLSPLQTKDIVALQAICRDRNVASGEVLLSAGTPVDRIFVVRTGEIQLAARRPLIGRRVVGLVHEGGVVADIQLFCDGPMPFDAIAAVDSVVIELDRAALLDLLRSSPSLGLRWATSVAKRLEHSQRRILSLLTQDLRAQVATMLLDERCRDGDHGWVVRLSHATMAQLLGVRRQSVSRVLGEFRRRGLVGGGYASLPLIDLEALAGVAGEPLEKFECGMTLTPSTGWDQQRLRA